MMNTWLTCSWSFSFIFIKTSLIPFALLYLFFHLWRIDQTSIFFCMSVLCPSLTLPTVLLELILHAVQWACHLLPHISVKVNNLFFIHSMICGRLTEDLSHMLTFMQLLSCFMMYPSFVILFLRQFDWIYMCLQHPFLHCL